jgi:hypothetical protein
VQADTQPPEVPAGKVYTGFRNKKGQKEGFGVMRSKDGSIYNGQWKQDRRDGHGTLFFEGGVFEGQWLRGGAHGEGKVRFKNGDTFEGLYADNKKFGPGLYRWKDGSEETGEYVDGHKHGWHKLTRGTNQWDLLYDKGGVVLAQMSGASVNSGPGEPPKATTELPTSRSTSKTRSKSPRNPGVSADASDRRGSALQARSKSPAVTNQPPYTRSSLKPCALQAKGKLSKTPSKSPRTSDEAPRDSNIDALRDDDMW